MQGTAFQMIESGTISVTRALSRNGTVFVHPGQFTDPSTLIACRKTWKKHFSVNIQDALSLSDSDDPRGALLINEGDFVSVNENIARRTGRRNQTLVARRSGRFLGVSSGSLIFETENEDLEEVRAGFPGTIADVIPDRGARIETTGSYIPCVWGNGRTGQGILLTLDDITREGIFSERNLSSAMNGSVIFANTCLDAEVLRATARLYPGGLIFGALPSELLPLAMELPFPVIVTDTLGTGRISSPVLSVLGDNIIKCAYLCAWTNSCEIIIPENDRFDPTGSAVETLAVGMQVRILDGFFSGEVGYVSELLTHDAEEASPEEITDEVKVRIDEETEVTLPAANIEIIRTAERP